MMPAPQKGLAGREQALQFLDVPVGLGWRRPRGLGRDHQEVRGRGNLHRGTVPAPRDHHRPAGRGAESGLIGHQHPGQAGDVLVVGVDAQLDGVAGVQRLGEELGVQVTPQLQLAAIVEGLLQVVVVVLDQRPHQLAQRDRLALDGHLVGLAQARWRQIPCSAPVDAGAGRKPRGVSLDRDQVLH